MLRVVGKKVGAKADTVGNQSQDAPSLDNPEVRDRKTEVV